jgi:cation:H+ antiporter
MLLSWLAIVAGFVLLIWSADRFVIGASATAFKLGVSPLIIGMVIMGFGTSAPEIFVGGSAAMAGNPSLAVGNAIGSNIANIALVLGLAALLVPLTVASNILKREFPALFIISGYCLLFMLDGLLSRWDGLALLIGTGVMVAWLFRLGANNRSDDPLRIEFESEVTSEMPIRIALTWLGVGLAMLLLSSQILVWGAVNIAHNFGISDLVIGLTIIAIGTSLPEIAVSISAALKNEHDIVIGNILGSNMFNLLAVLGVSSSIASTPLAPEVLHRDFPIMIGLMVALFIMAYGFRGKGRINRIEALMLLSAYVAYMVLLYFTEI